MPDSTNLIENQVIPLPAAGKCFYYPGCTLQIDKVEGTNITVSYRYESGKSGTFSHDLAQKGALTIGRREDNILCLPAPTISRQQAKIYLDDKGEIKYQHVSRIPIPNPLASKPELIPEMIETIEAEKGNGGGYTHQNRKPGSGRVSNEDRGIAHQGPGLKDKAAILFLSNLITNDIVPATGNPPINPKGGRPGGSTLSMAMRTKDGHFACANLADSPILLIARNPETDEIRLLQMSIPHNGIGEEIRHVMSGKLRTRNFDSLLEDLASKGIDPATARSPHGTDAHITRTLGGYLISNHTPDIYIVDPAIECPPGFEIKGIMVCSDGIDNGIKEDPDHIRKGAVQKALQPLFAAGADPDPVLVAKTAVDAARFLTTDNVTATMLPLHGEPGDLIAVADGYEGTAAVAQQAVESIRLKCQELPVSLTHAFEGVAVVKNGEKYRMHVEDGLLSTPEKKQRLESIKEAVLAAYPHYTPGNASVDRATLTLNNPPQGEFRNLLIAKSRETKAQLGM